MNHLKPYSLFESETPHPFTREDDLPQFIIDSLDYLYPISDDGFSIDAYTGVISWNITIMSAWMGPGRLKGFFIEEIIDTLKSFESYCDSNNLKYKYHITYSISGVSTKKRRPYYINSSANILEKLKGVKLDTLIVELDRENNFGEK